jgi:hypothetical protein
MSTLHMEIVLKGDEHDGAKIGPDKALIMKSAGGLNVRSVHTNESSGDAIADGEEGQQIQFW